ncbi:MAG TPA: hypothetical protein PLR43_05970, partial [Syntrophales bacterium]|nr:hypothetical protein [Syntrophales bacterium]
HTNPVFYDMGFGNGVDGCDVVELEAPREILGFLPETVRTVFHASTDLFNDYTEAFPCPVERVAIPALGGPGAVVLGLLILAAALWMIRRRRTFPGSLFLFFLIAVLAVRLAWAASIVLDGQVGDWAGLSPAVTDPSGDSSSGNPYEDICLGYATSDTGKLYFRMDVTGRKGELPSISLEKSTNGEYADLPPGPTVNVGYPVLWTYVTTNTGNIPLTGVTVTDDQGVTVTCPKMTLEPGESMTCTGSGTATAGQYANVGTASGNPPSGPAVTVSDPSHYYGTSYQGCTPAYWKNHAGSWPPTGYATTQTVASVFPNAASWPAIASSTLLQALDFAGGPYVEGAVEILLRAGVAALLNASHPGVSYPRTAADVLTSVNGALGTGERDPMLLLAASLDADNNRGCPLS